MYLNRLVSSKANVNIISSVLFAALTSLSYFIVYKIIISRLGVNFMGIWALILGYTSILSQSVSSITTNLIRKIAGYTEAEFKERFSSLIFNALFVYLLFFLSLLIIVLLSISLLFPKAFLSIVSYQVIFVVIVSNFLTLLTTILSTALDGRNKFYLKNFYLAISLIISFVFFIFTIQKLSIWAIAYMLLLQSLLSLLFIFYYVKTRCHLVFSLSFFSLTETKSILKESWKLQASSLLVLCYEPVIKYFLSLYGVANVALYEISNKIILQIKNIFAIIVQTLLPNIVSLYKSNQRDFVEYYYNLKTTFFHAAALIFTLSIVFLPLVSLFFLKIQNNQFFFIFSILAVGSLVNIIGIPSHIQFIAINKLNTPLVSFLSILIGLLIFCPVLGIFFSGLGVIVGVCISLILGTLVTIIRFEKMYDNKVSKNVSALLMLNCSIFLISIFITCFQIQLVPLRYALYFVVAIGASISAYFLFKRIIKTQIS
jgi:O-antigen/teichoic acid export membrane protein